MASSPSSRLLHTLSIILKLSSLAKGPSVASAFYALKKHHLQSKQTQVRSAHLRFKANQLLKCSKQLNVKDVLWRWYLASSGRKIMRGMSRHLVLNSSIGKTTFFYRLKAGLKAKTIIEASMKRKESLMR